jgi:hypothetical protein
MRRVAIGAPWLKHPFVPADQAVRSRQCELKKSWRGRAPFAEHGPARRENSDAPRHDARIRLRSVLLVFGRQLRRSVPMIRTPAGIQNVMGTPIDSP